MITKGSSRTLWGLALVSLFAAATAAAQTFEVVHSFSAHCGSDPQAGIVQTNDGNFVGTTVGGMGTLFKMDAFGRFGTIHVFQGTDGANPHAPLTLTPDGEMYGTTMNGLAGWGGVYRLDPSGALTVIKTFIPSDRGTEGEGATPHSPLIRVTDTPSAEGVLYGVTTRGGKDDLGTIYAIDANNVVRTLKHFSGFDGALPFESLIELDHHLYGTTTRGGATDNGTIFRIDPSGANFTVIHNFGVADGTRPEAPLMALNGVLFGTTSTGGRFGMGTAFRVDASGTNFSVLHHFAGLDGSTPHAALVKARDGYLYGTTISGGGNYFGSGGNVFRMNWTGGEFAVVHQFHGSDGAYPQTRLIEATDGALYGSTAQGGLDNRGVVFRVVFVPITSMAPTSGPAQGGTPIQITGRNFQAAASLTFSGVDAGETQILDDTSIHARTPALRPGTLSDVLVDNLDRTRGGILNGYFADFLDVPQLDIFHAAVEKIFRNGITSGRGDGTYGRNLSATNAQMAVFLLKAMHGPFYTPPPATGTVFSDVPADNPFAPWIEQLYFEGITTGCKSYSFVGRHFCPNAPTTRDEMARLLLKAEHGSNYVPPACTGIFLDVPCPSYFAPWIEQLYSEGITGGCKGGQYFCPGEPSTRGQTAVFLTKTFSLP